jgi:hypothetical protein
MRATTLLRRQLALKRTRSTGFEFTAVGIEIDVAPLTGVPYCSACLRKRHLDMTTETAPGGTSTSPDGDDAEVPAATR